MYCKRLLVAHLQDLHSSARLQYVHSSAHTEIHGSGGTSLRKAAKHGTFSKTRSNELIYYIIQAAFESETLQAHITAVLMSTK